MNARGVIVRESEFSVKETIDFLEDTLKKNGVTIYARINQQAEVSKGGLTLNPLEFLMFGNPVRGGTIMAVNPVAALDLPLKLIAWQDNLKRVWVAYNDATYIQERFSLNTSLAQLVDIDPLISKILKQ